MEWEDVPSVVDEWVAKSREPARAVKHAAADVYTDTDVGYYYSPSQNRVAIYAQRADQDAALCKSAMEGLRQEPCLFLSYQELADAASDWIKVAHSPTLRRAGELLNFFPGQYPGGIPNAPSPLAAMLTSGLLGAGLGYGAGHLVSAILPPRVGKKVKKTATVAGGALGATPGALWGLASDDGWLSPKPLDPAAGSLAEWGKTAAALEPIELGSMYKQAIGAGALSYERPEPKEYDPLAVNINALGQTLWDIQAPPAIAATTLGAVYAAQQVPDRSQNKGEVTYNQLGRLAQSAAGDYVTGVLVGAALNTLIGTPFTPATYGLGNAVLGTVVPRLFGGR
jgi:hypothetical protein